ncbi:MAG: J domain-containing protein [Rhodopseudomonas palustris]|nr:J domain-containing protein [Rhodopseudomonas palustris]
MDARCGGALQKDALTGHPADLADGRQYRRRAGQAAAPRPSWKLRPTRSGMFSGELNGRGRLAAPGRAAPPARPKVETRKVLQRRAQGAAGDGARQPARRWKSVKAKYKALVELHHPDANGGDRSTEDRLIEIIKAYNYLKTVVRA